ncbi:MAG: helix-turn-helix domain-containing protein [Desulfarculales bacterium]|jgi:excisionase family DNA binding protein|nr:helix-turn-helix domain-containing protein [Desulfarculales bacterium]
MEINANNRWLTTAQAAEYLQCSESFLHQDRHTRLHGIPFSRLGRHVRYRQSDLDEFLECAKSRAGETGNEY